MSRKEEALEEVELRDDGEGYGPVLVASLGPLVRRAALGIFGRSYVEVGFVQGGAMKLIVMLGIVLLRVGKVCERSLALIYPTGKSQGKNPL